MDRFLKIFLIITLVLFIIIILIITKFYLQSTKQQIFNNEIKCITLLKGLTEVYNNVAGIYYDTEQNTCIVRTESSGLLGAIKEKPLQDIGKK